MEENKNEKVEQNAQNGGAVNGGRKRRHHRGGKNRGGNGQKPQNDRNAVEAQAQQKQQKQGGQQKQGNPQKQSQPQAEMQKNKPAPVVQNQNKQQANKQKPAKQTHNQPKGNNERKKDENRKDTYVYVLDGNLYINLTNKCSNGCDFCVRNERDSYYGNYLWLRHGDPTPEKVIAQANGMGDLSRFNEVVFCGFGEPTYKVAEMVALCDYFHEKGLKTRLNTNGQGNLINKRDIVPDLVDKIDFVNISLNASCVEKYQPICRSQFGEGGFAGLIEFAKLCRKNGVACRFSIVDCIGEEEVEACKRLAESVRIPLYVRKYIQDS